MLDVSFKGEAMEERLCSKVDVSAGCRKGPMDSPVNQHTALLVWVLGVV